MERKYFFEPYIAYMGIFEFCILIPCVFIYVIHKFIGVFLETPDIKYLLFLCFMLLLSGGLIWVNTTMFTPRMDYLVVTGDYVEWHGIFRRKKRLCYRDCPFVDIETFNKEAQCDIVRGDECAMIYLSTEPYPEDMRGRINHVYCSDTFIKFRYTDKLAEALLEVLPEDKARMIRAFYKGMKHKDEMLERERKERKKRRRRK